MLSESIKEIFIEFDKKFEQSWRRSDERFNKQSENFDKTLLKHDLKLIEQRREFAE